MGKTMTGKAKRSTRRTMAIEAESWARHLETHWPTMLAGTIATAAKLRVVHDRGGHWIHTPLGLTDADVEEMSRG